MDVSGIVSAATDMTLSRTADAVQLSVLKKAMDIEAQGALKLIQSVSQVISNNPPNLGNGVNTFA